MPTKHPRINVAKGPDLAAAISRARSVMANLPEATIVHDLALRGAEALAEDERGREEAIDDLVFVGVLVGAPEVLHHALLGRTLVAAVDDAVKGVGSPLLTSLHRSMTEKVEEVVRVRGARLII